MSKQASQQKIGGELSIPLIFLEPAQSLPQNLEELMCALKENEYTFPRMGWNGTLIYHIAPLYNYEPD